MLQKPSVETLSSLLADHFYLTDIGVWILSDRAVKVLMQHSSAIGKELDGDVINYDMYGEFGCALGSEPVIKDAAVNDLKVAILPLPGGEFYHFGTSHELLSSMLAIQNLVSDQREIMHHDRKPHPSMFVQNTDVKIKWNENNRNIWVENAFIGAGWTLTKENIVTGVPENNWTLTLSEGQCVDVVPIGENQWAVRPYGFNDKFRGDLAEVEYLGGSFAEWAKERGVCIDDIEGRHDLQAARIFPIVSNVDDMGIVLRWMLSDPSLEEGKTIWAASRRVSADEISSEANLCRLVAQRTKFRWQRTGSTASFIRPTFRAPLATMDVTTFLSPLRCPLRHHSSHAPRTPCSAPRHFASQARTAASTRKRRSHSCVRVSRTKLCAYANARVFLYMPTR